MHKTEMGGVHLNLADVQAVKKSFEVIRARLAKENKLDAMDGVVVQPMLSGGIEVMVGVTHDPLFGPLIAFGLGGSTRTPAPRRSLYRTSPACRSS